MSLLPGRILPQIEPFGTLSEDGKTVIIAKNWWLLFYNMALQSIGTGSGLPADALIDLESIDGDALDTDAIALRAPIAANANLIPADADPIPSIQDVKNALLLAYSALDAADAALASPTAKVGLTAVNGSASTAMRSDAAPPIDQAIAPTWTSQHIFSAGGGAGTGASVAVVTSGNPNWCLSRTTNGVDSKTWECIMNATQLIVRAVNDANSASSFALSITRSAATISAMSYGNSTDKPPHTFFGAVGVNGVTPPAQVTGWGIPTGPAVVANFPGATATLVQCSNAIAEIIKDLKAFGLYGA